MEFLICLLSTVVVYCGAEINVKSPFMNKLVKVKPVGKHIGKTFLPLTELPPPHEPHPYTPEPHPHPHVHVDKSGRRHLVDLADCTEKHIGHQVYEGGHVAFFADYYDDRIEKTVATVIIPDHIDHKHFEVTESGLYYTVGEIDGIGYHHSTLRSEHPSECEKIYQDHVADQYSDESNDYSEESLEMARMPLFNDDGVLDDNLKNMYEDNFSV